MLPFGPHARLYTRLAFGNLATFHVLDDRQYRSPQVCPRPGRGGSNVVDAAECAELAEPKPHDAGRGPGALARSRAQGIAHEVERPRAADDHGAVRPESRARAGSAWTDGWDGYPAARRKLVDFIAGSKVANPVVIGGDVHMFLANDIKRDFDNPGSATVASEFVGTSITSQAFPQDTVNRFLPDNPHVKLADSRFRGYTRMELTQGRSVTDLRAMDTVTKRDGACTTLATFVVEDGRPGAQKA